MELWRWVFKFSRTKSHTYLLNPRDSQRHPDRDQLGRVCHLLPLPMNATIGTRPGLTGPHRGPRRSGGQTLVEFALVLPIFLLLLFGLLDAGRWF